MMALFFALLLACGGGGQQCLYTSDCGDGFVCDETGTCSVAECANNTQCGIGTYCNGDNVCTSGCSEDLDCEAGTTCNVEAHQCEAYGCRTTELDCALGQYCDTSTGECLDDERGHCNVCDVDGGNNQCDAGTCVIWDVFDTCNNDNQCGTDETCDLFLEGRLCHKDRCLLTCDPGAELNCPRGLTCTVGVLADAPNTAYCLGDCDYLKEFGFLP
jgi:hypothetical protein